MPEPPSTDTLIKYLEAAEKAIIAHGLVKRYKMQRLRLGRQISFWKAHKEIKVYMAASWNTNYVRSAPYLETL